MARCCLAFIAPKSGDSLIAQNHSFTTAPGKHTVDDSFEKCEKRRTVSALDTKKVRNKRPTFFISSSRFSSSWPSVRRRLKSPSSLSIASRYWLHWARSCSKRWWNWTSYSQTVSDKWRKQYTHNKLVVFLSCWEYKVFNTILHN